MQQDHSFPLDRCSKRLRTVIMNEFQGRRPTVDEVNRIPAKDWLAAPGMGPTLLRELDSLTQVQPSEPRNTLTSLSDDELLNLLESLQRKMDNLHRDVQRLISSRPMMKFIHNRSDLH
jgi:hypothetical protein